MNKNLWIALGVIVIVAIGIGVILKSNQNKLAYEKESAMMQNKTDKKTEKDDTMMNKEDSMMKDEAKTDGEAMMDKDNAMMKETGSYKDYSSATVEAEQLKGNKMVLFFHAPWCPFCKAANSAFLSRASDIPAGVTVLKTDYDSNSELKKKYGVTYQHTFVQIDSNGNLVTKWNGGDIDSLKQNIK